MPVGCACVCAHGRMPCVSLCMRVGPRFFKPSTVAASSTQRGNNMGGPARAARARARAHANPPSPHTQAHITHTNLGGSVYVRKLFQPDVDGNPADFAYVVANVERGRRTYASWTMAPYKVYELYKAGRGGTGNAGEWGTTCCTHHAVTCCMS